MFSLLVIAFYHEKYIIVYFRKIPSSILPYKHLEHLKIIHGAINGGKCPLQQRGATAHSTGPN